MILEYDLERIDSDFKDEMKERKLQMDHLQDRINEAKKSVIKEKLLGAYFTYTKDNHCYSAQIIEANCSYIIANVISYSKKSIDRVNFQLDYVLKNFKYIRREDYVVSARHVILSMFDDVHSAIKKISVSDTGLTDYINNIKQALNV